MEDLPQMERLDDRTAARYRTHLYKVALSTGEVVECINNGNDLYELERVSEYMPVDDNHVMRQVYVSSYPIPEQILRKNSSGERAACHIRDLGEVVIENSAIYNWDTDGSPVTLGSHPYYLLVIQ